MERFFSLFWYEGESQNVAIFAKEDEVFTSHLWDLNTFITYALVTYRECWRKAVPKEHRFADTGFLLISHDRLGAFTHNQADSHLLFTQRDQFSPVDISTVQIIKCQKLSVSANLSTSLRCQQKAPV